MEKRFFGNEEPLVWDKFKKIFVQKIRSKECALPKGIRVHTVKTEQYDSCEV